MVLVGAVFVTVELVEAVEVSVLADAVFVTVDVDVTGVTTQPHIVLTRDDCKPMSGCGRPAVVLEEEAAALFTKVCCSTLPIRFVVKPTSRRSLAAGVVLGQVIKVVVPLLMVVVMVDVATVLIDCQ